MYLEIVLGAILLLRNAGVGEGWFALCVTVCYGERGEGLGVSIQMCYVTCKNNFLSNFSPVANKKHQKVRRQRVTKW